MLLVRPPSFILAFLPLLRAPQSPLLVPVSQMSCWNALSLQTGLSTSGSIFDPEVVSCSLTVHLCISDTKLPSPACTSPRSASRWYLPWPTHQHHLRTKRTPQSEQSKLNSWASSLICSLHPSRCSGQNA